jgi:CubicO group peptidase (beta-lactamase class C family)
MALALGLNDNEEDRMAMDWMKCGVLAVVVALVPLGASAQADYFPGADWQRRSAQQAGFDAAKVDEAIQFAVASEMKNPRDLVMNHYQTFGREPFGYAIGPIRERGEPTGVILHRGYLVAEWGEPMRVDMTHSVTKSMLSTIVGVAFDRGMIRSLDDPVRDYVGPIQVYNPVPAANKTEGLGHADLLFLFETPHNRTITWDHMLRQVSDWEGVLWGKPDWADRPEGEPQKWATRARNKPGSVYKYNDVRVNALALATLNVWRKPLPQVLKETVMDPIGASSTWRWFGYENSFIVLDGQVMQSVTGGGHWGGGLFINAYDMARFGLLTMRKGRWGDRQLVSQKWIGWALTPTPAQPGYGFMNFYNNLDGKMLPSAPRTAFGHLGNGTNFVYVDPENELVVVLRWIDRAAIDGVVQRLLAARVRSAR